MSHWNGRVIAEFRARDDVTRGWDKSLVVTHTVGGRSGAVGRRP